jgi:hypothetical protein
VGVQASIQAVDSAYITIMTAAPGQQTVQPAVLPAVLLHAVDEDSGEAADVRHTRVDLVMSSEL